MEGLAFSLRFPGVQKPLDQYGSSSEGATGSESEKKEEEEEEEEDDFELFGSDDDEEEEEEEEVGGDREGVHEDEGMCQFEVFHLCTYQDEAAKQLREKRLAQYAEKKGKSE